MKTLSCYDCQRYCGHIVQGEWDNRATVRCAKCERKVKALKALQDVLHRAQSDMPDFLQGLFTKIR